MCEITTKFAAWPLTTTMSEDHTRSFGPYKAILEPHEQEYRESEGDERSAVIDEISQEIGEAARQGRAKITGGDELQKVCGMLAL